MNVVTVPQRPEIFWDLLVSSFVEIPASRLKMAQVPPTSKVFPNRQKKERSSKKLNLSDLYCMFPVTSYSTLANTRENRSLCIPTGVFERTTVLS
jgi:hypothetical protein